MRYVLAMFMLAHLIWFVPVLLFTPPTWGVWVLATVLLLAAWLGSMLSYFHLGRERCAWCKRELAPDEATMHTACREEMARIVAKWPQSSLQESPGRAGS